MKTFGFQWHLSDRCNQRCAHCYQEDFTGASEPTLSVLLQMAARVLPALADTQVSVNLTGGEPLLLSHLPDLIKSLAGYQNLVEMNLISNGTVLAEAALSAMAREPKFGQLKISIESAEARVHDAIRGEGNLAVLRRNLPRLRKASGRPLVLMATLARYNLSGIESLLRFAEDHGAAGIIFERFVPMGRGDRLRDQVLGGDEWLQAIESIVRASGLDADPADLPAYRAFWLATGIEAEEPRRGALCNLGAGSMALMPDGTVFPCRRLPIAVGQVLTEPFAAIRARLRKYQPGGDCVGCRALANALSEDGCQDDSESPLVLL